MLKLSKETRYVGQNYLDFIFYFDLVLVDGLFDFI